MKDYLIEVILKKMLPSAVRAILAAFTGLLVAHAGVLAKAGVAYDAAAQTVTLHLSTFDDWAVAAGLGLVTAILAMIQHHATQAIAPKA